MKLDNKNKGNIDNERKERDMNQMSKDLSLSEKYSDKVKAIFMKLESESSESAILDVRNIIDTLYFTTVKDLHIVGTEKYSYSKHREEFDPKYDPNE